MVKYISLLLLPLTAVVMTLSAGANAAEKQMAVHHHGHAIAAKGNLNEAARAYESAMSAMHQNAHVPLSGDPDADFTRQMIPHHEGALNMAKIQQKYGQDESLKRFNDWVIAAQTKEIGFMKTWLRRRDNGLGVKDAKDYYGEAMAKMHSNMAIKYTGNADVDYAYGMIAHHQGAVDMASILLAQGSDPELNRLANDIYSSQTYEIAWLKTWLKEHGYNEVR